MNKYIITEKEVKNLVIGQNRVRSRLYNPQSERETALDEVASLLDKLYWWYDCEPQPSVEFEEGACDALKHALTKIEELRQKDGEP